MRDQQHDDGGVVYMVEIRQGFAKRLSGERRRREAAARVGGVRLGHLGGSSLGAAPPPLPLLI